MAKPKVRIIPLGGLGEIGKNMTVFEYGNEAIIVDCGMAFPTNDQHGVDYIIPDFTYLKERTDLKIHGVFFTHGHEDHIGATTHFLELFPSVPLYATRLTAGLIDVKVRNGRRFDEVALKRDPTIKILKPGIEVKVGPFTIEPFRMTHSIPDCVGFAINTPHGLIVHTGDYKYDNNPVSGELPDYARLAQLGSQNVRLLMGDSTNADKAGWTPSESVIEPAFERVFEQAKGRIMIATFASLISRVQQVANVARKYKRKLAIAGFTMREYVKLAREIGYLDVPDHLLVDAAKTDSMQPHQIVMMVTGSQGEPSAVLGKLSVGRHKFLDVRKNDTIVVSSHPIPGNEESVYQTIDRLIERGANVVYEPLEKVHVSGHGNADEILLTINLVKPTFLMPVHGETRHLHQHAKLGVQAGVPESNIILSQNGVVIEMDKHYIRKAEEVPSGALYIDGGLMGDVGRAVIRDREILARDGFLIVSVNVDRKTGEVIGRPNIVSRGFVYLREADSLINGLQNKVKDVIRNTSHLNGSRRDVLEDDVSKYLYDETRRRPMVFSIINEV